jgi:hypothetical protein
MIIGTINHDKELPLQSSAMSVVLGTHSKLDEPDVMISATDRIHPETQVDSVLHPSSYLKFYVLGL